MADSHCSTRTCDVCGIEYEPTINSDGSVRRTKYSHCSKACGKRRNSDPGLVRGVRPCVRCGLEFSANPWQKHCSPQCRWGAKQTIEQIRAASPNWRYCAVCLKHYYGRPSGTNAKAGSDRKFCSMACRVAMRERVRLEVDALRRMAAQRARKARAAEIADRVEANRARRDAYRQARLDAASARPCVTCGGPVGYSFAPYRKYCSRACVRAADSYREARRTHKARRRARKRGAFIESVSPAKVFDRAGWRCQICGVKTPAKYRGTIRNDAPELDHIVPLSKGGAHSYDNTQCACRRCNQWKSDTTVVGQGLLPI